MRTAREEKSSCWSWPNLQEISMVSPRVRFSPFCSFLYTMVLLLLLNACLFYCWKLWLFSISCSSSADHRILQVLNQSFDIVAMLYCPLLGLCKNSNTTLTSEPSHLWCVAASLMSHGVMQGLMLQFATCTGTVLSFIKLWSLYLNMSQDSIHILISLQPLAVYCHLLRCFDKNSAKLMTGLYIDPSDIYQLL